MIRFILGENPMKPELSGIWIIQLINPVTIIKVDQGHVETPIGKFFTYTNSESVVEYWTLSIYNPQDMDRDVAFKTINRAWHWYMAYMKWEDDG